MGEERVRRCDEGRRGAWGRGEDGGEMEIKEKC